MILKVVTLVLLFIGWAHGHGTILTEDPFYKNCDQSTKVCRGLGEDGSPGNCVENQSCVFAGSIAQSTKYPGDFIYELYFSIPFVHKYPPCIRRFILLDTLKVNSTNGSLKCKDETELSPSDLLPAVYVDKNVPCDEPPRECVQNPETCRYPYFASASSSISKVSLKADCIEDLANNRVYDVNGKKLLRHWTFVRGAGCDPDSTSSINWTEVLKDMKPVGPNGGFYTNFPTLSALECSPQS